MPDNNDYLKQPAGPTDALFALGMLGVVCVAGYYMTQAILLNPTPAKTLYLKLGKKWIPLTSGSPYTEASRLAVAHRDSKNLGGTAWYKGNHGLISNRPDGISVAHVAYNGRVFSGPPNESGDMLHDPFDQGFEPAKKKTTKGTKIDLRDSSESTGELIEQAFLKAVGKKGQAKYMRDDMGRNRWIVVRATRLSFTNWYVYEDHDKPFGVSFVAYTSGKKHVGRPKTQDEIDAETVLLVMSRKVATTNSWVAKHLILEAFKRQYPGMHYEMDFLQEYTEYETPLWRIFVTDPDHPDFEPAIFHVYDTDDSDPGVDGLGISFEQVY